MQGSGACWPGPRSLGPGPASEMLERRRDPASHGTVAFGNHPSPPNETRTHKFETQQEEKNSVCRKSISEWRDPGPRACGPGLQGAWGPGPQGLGPGPSGFGAFSPTQITITRGCQLKRRDLEGNEAGIPPPTPPPPPPTPPPHFGPEKGVFTLSAFGNHPTRPPRSADQKP